MPPKKSNRKKNNQQMNPPPPPPPQYDPAVFQAIVAAAVAAAMTQINESNYRGLGSGANPSTQGDSHGYPSECSYKDFSNARPRLYTVNFQTKFSILNYQHHI